MYLWQENRNSSCFFLFVFKIFNNARRSQIERNRRNESITIHILEGQKIITKISIHFSSGIFGFIFLTIDSIFFLILTKNKMTFLLHLNSMHFFVVAVEWLRKKIIEENEIFGLPDENKVRNFQELINILMI